MRPSRAGYTLALGLALLLSASGHTQPSGAPERERPVVPPAGESTASALASSRMMTLAQYKNLIAYTFGPDVKVDRRFASERRVKGLLALSSASRTMTSGVLDRLELSARDIAAQVTDKKHRSVLIPCSPREMSQADERCADRFIRETGRLLFRRPLTERQVQVYVGTANAAAQRLNSFHDGLALALEGMLISPSFLYFVDVTESDPARPGQLRLDGYSKAARLSLFLWNAPPDTALLDAAENGELHSELGIRRQVQRMLATSRVEQGVRDFFSDYMLFELFDTVAKDPTIYPAYTSIVGTDAKEQALRTIVDHLLMRRDDYRTLFTTRHTFMTPDLASVYGVEVDPLSPWSEFAFDEGDPRAGLISQVSFTSLYSHPGRSSATRRGKALREIFLCQTVPDPPPDVDFTILEDPTRKLRTGRERVNAHLANPICAGCHRVTDPIGLALENFDGAGSFRTSENGVAIDASGELDGRKFVGPAGLGEAMRDNPRVAACLVNRLYSYGLGRPATTADRSVLKELEKGFAQTGYVVPALLESIALDSTFLNGPAGQSGTLSADVR